METLRSIRNHALRMALLFVAALGSQLVAVSQCPNNNTLLPGPAITPNCPGTTVVPCMTGGQYALLNVTAGNIYTFSTCGASWDTQLTIYNNAGGGSLGTNDDSFTCGFFSLQSYLAWTATFTGQLRVLMDQAFCANNNLCASLTITCATPPVAMTNNECGGAIPLFVLDGCLMQTYTNTGATRSTPTPNPTCGGPFTNASFRDVWFSFTAPANGVVIIESVPGTLTDGVMQLVSGTCATFANVECDDDDGVGFMPRIDRRCAPLVPGALYFIRYWGLGGTQGSFGLCVRSISTFTTPQEDCAGGLTVCGDQQLNNSANFTGCTADLNAGNRGCLTGNERQGSWYRFSPSASGNVALSILPTGNVDYDFAIWGPMSTITCPPSAPPVRCSWALPANVAGFPGALAFQTGLRAAAADVSEGAGGPGVDGWVSILPVVAGQFYLMYIDNFDVNGQAFTLDWTLSAGASLDCTLLPVELTHFDAVATGTAVKVTWTTVTEHASSHFMVERASDGLDFAPIGRLEAAGFSQQRLEYSLLDPSPYQGANYYRLQQVDLDGSVTPSSIASVEYRISNGTLFIRPNPALSEVWVTMPPALGDAFTLVITDATGRVAQTQGPLMVPANGVLRTPVHQLPSGGYFLHLYQRNGQRAGTARFMKQ